MATWQPPIPAGAFCSPEAIKINTALPLLGWCYDQVGRDGWLTLNLHAVAGDVGVPYHTIKKWWSALRASDFIALVDERGRGGMRVRLADHWIDWRILSKRETGPNMVLISQNGTETGPDQVSNTEKRDRNGTETGPNMVPNNPAYKVLSRSEDQESEDRDGTARTLAHPAVAMYLRAFPQIRLNQKQEASITALVGDGVERLECWQEVIHDYELSTHWKPENVGNMKNRFENKLRDRKAKAPDTRPALPIVLPDPNRPDPAESRRKTAELARQLRGT